MPLTFCPLTGRQLKADNSKIHEATAPVFSYEFKLIGKAKIALPTYQVFLTNRDFNHLDLAGICRNAFEDKVEPPLINTEFITNGIKSISVPKTIKEKGYHLLKYMYHRGGNHFADFEFSSPGDFTIPYATGEEEFNKIMTSLRDRNFIKIETDLGMSGHIVVYKGVTLTDLGIAEVEKELPNIPMIGLLNQTIATGTKEIDEKINHSKKLFFDDPENMEMKRSACETLIFILEPLRSECETLFSKGDISDFFKIVNEFDIRHNKDRIKQIQYPEQLEWIFYSLLNTINTYCKLKKKLSKR